MAACINPQGSPQATSPVTSVSTATVRTGGRIVWAVTAEPPSPDLQLTGGAHVSAQFFYRVYDRLLTFDADGKLAPALAASWDQPNPSTWVMKLRDNAKFSNGRAVRASDVVKTFQRLYDPKTGSRLGARTGPLKEAKAIDELTVQFDLERPYAPFPSGLTWAWTGILPMQELEARAFDPTKEMLGSGPFILKEQLKGEAWTFQRNPYYWRTGQPNADELVMLIVPDQAARIAALRTGRADIALFDGIDSPRLLGEIPNVKVVTQSLPEFYALYVNAKTPPTEALKDQRVRQALNLAIDRDQVIRTALGGAAKPVFGTIPGLADDCDAARLPKRDIAQAKSLLAAAGATGLSFEIISFPASIEANAVGIAQVLQQNLAEAGLNARLQPLEYGAWLKAIGSGTPDPAKFDTSVTFLTAGSDNWLGLSNWSPTASAFTAKYQLGDATFDALLDQTVSMRPGPDRARIFQQMCGKIAETANIIPIASRVNFVAYRTDHLDANVQTFEPIGDFVRQIAGYARRP
jgi:peptide/nickel transport system substrate-binding protein